MNISVILPIYGVEKYIEKSLRSLFSQTKTDGIEFILVNDCTKDSSMEIARQVILEYSNLDIKIVEHKVNKGLPSARQSGLDIATGDYILHIDSDDWCEPNMLEDLYACAIENKADVVICDYFENQPDKEIYRKQITSSNHGIECIGDMYRRKFNYGVWNKLVKRSIYTDNNITTVPNLNMAEDLILNSRLLCYAQNIVCLPKAYIHYRRMPTSMASQNKSSVQIKEYMSVALLEIEKFYQERGFTNIIDTHLNYLKVTLKYNSLMGVEQSQQKEYSKLFPYATSYIFSQTALPLTKRIILFMATKGIFFPLNITRAIKKLR